jgi:16S rRNA G527 N7-methylase RsmG
MVESKTRKSVFLKEALRALEMRDADVATARFEELLDRRPLIGAHDILTVRAVRVDTKDLAALEGFVRLGGQLMLFRRNTDVRVAAPPGLALTGTHALVEALQSQLVVFTKLN